MRLFEIVSPIPSPLYHGTSATFDRFESGQSIRPQTSMGGFSFTSNPQSAYSYAVSAARMTGGKPRVVTADLIMRQPLDITAAMTRARRRGLSFGDAKRAALTQYDPAVHDGVIFRGNAQNPDEYVVFNPDQIRVREKSKTP